MPPCDPAILQKLLAWFSPSFPAGSFAYSHALEWMVESKAITTSAQLHVWLSNVLLYGAGQQDAKLLAASWRGAQAQDMSALCACNALALALPATPELLLETKTQGMAFYRTILLGWPHPALKALPFAPGAPIAYPVAVGAVAACHGVPLAPCLHAYLMGFAGMVLSAAQRLAVLGQSEAQKCLAALLPVMARVADAAHEITIAGEEDVALLGGCAYGVDIASCHHAGQYSRLFRS